MMECIVIIIFTICIDQPRLVFYLSSHRESECRCCFIPEFFAHSEKPVLIGFAQHVVNIFTNAVLGLARGVLCSVGIDS